MNSEINGQRYYRSTILVELVSFPFLSFPFRFIARRKKGVKSSPPPPLAPRDRSEKVGRESA